MKLDTFQFGKTTTRLPILGHRFGSTGPEVLILGGVHGNEPEGVRASFGLIRHFSEIYSYKLRLTIVPQFNLDGVLALTRKNARGVDLNRNLPTKDWSRGGEYSGKDEKYYAGAEANSESENQALVAWIATTKPRLIMSLHSWQPMLNVNGNCLPEATVLSRLTGYRIDKDIGYPTPGCLGTYCGLERDIPTLTYEIERGLGSGPIDSVHVPAIAEALKVTEGRL